MKNEETIFAEAMGIESPAARAAYLEQECGGDASLRQQIEALLRANDRAAGFMQSPAPIPDVTAFGDSSGSSPLAHPEVEPVGTSVGPYKLLERIGEGGMGVVYMADQLHPVRRRVALKIIKPGMDSRQLIARFEAERQALAMMDHPSIARVLDAGTTDAGRPYFAMELVKGVPITDYCDQNNLTPRERLGLFVQVCQAIQHAHTKGVIHRDLKPSNILVTLHDGVPVPKVIDFGIAKATGGAAQQLTDKTLFTHFAQMIGTPLYMSPEQAEFSGLDVDTRSDVYSLGVLLYELLTGTTPFDKQRLGEAALDEIRRIIREEEPPRPSTRISTLGETLTAVSAHRKTDPGKLGQSMRGELDWIVMKSLEKDRTRRYETANGLARDVERYLADETVQACPPSAFYRFQKFSRRNKPLIVTTALVCAALLLGTIVSTWLAVRATKAERLARSEAANALTQARKAETEAAVSHAVNEFVNQDLLAQADPDNEPDRDVKLRTIVDRAAEKVEGRFKDQPMVEAAVRKTLAAIYESLGEYAQAEKHLRRAAEFRRAHLGVEHQSTLETLNALAWVYLRLERYPEAEEMSRHVLEASRRLLGEEARTTLTAMHIIATTLDRQGRHDEAEELGKKAMAAWQRTLGEDHLGTLNSMNQLANVYLQQGRLVEAEQLYVTGMEILRRTKGKEHPTTLMLVANLGRIYQRQRRYAEAEALIRHVLEVRRNRLGATHPHTLDSLQQLTNLLKQFGRLEELQALYEEILAGQREQFGQHHPQTRKTLRDYITFLRDHKKDRVGALKPLHELLAASVAEKGVDSEESARTMADLATMLHLAERNGDAEAYYRRVLAISTPVWKDSVDRAEALYHLCGLLNEAQRYSESEPLLTELWQWIESHPRNETHNTYPWRVAWRRIVTYTALGQRERARAAYQQASALRAPTPSDDNSLAWAFVTYRDPAGRDASWALELAESAVNRAPDSYAIVNTLGLARYRTGQLRQAVEDLRKSAELAGGGSSADFFFLAMATQKLGDSEAARRWYQRAVEWMQQNDPHSGELVRFRAEAEQILGLPPTTIPTTRPTTSPSRG